MVRPGIPDRLAQRQAAEHQRERDEPEQRVREGDDELHADRERQQHRVGRLPREHDHDQRLLGAHAAGGQRQERRDRSDDEHQQRVPDVGVDAERPQHVEHRADAAEPAERLREDDLDGEPARLVQDREALAHALAEVACHLHRVAQQQESEQDERGDDQAGGARVPDGERTARRPEGVAGRAVAGRRPACTRR